MSGKLNRKTRQVYIKEKETEQNIDMSNQQNSPNIWHFIRVDYKSNFVSIIMSITATSMYYNSNHNDYFAVN